MCGLLGFIGVSKKPEVSQQLITDIFVKTQIRGTDASGYYCTSDFSESEVYFYKEPLPSSVFVKNKNYIDLWNFKTNLGLFHCRAATQGVGPPASNKNNHPFVSHDFQKAVIHNGFINKNEFKELKKIYETETDCDSEIILRMMEQDGTFEEIVSDLISWTEKSAFAVAYSQSDKNFRHLCLFRNHLRPLWIIDLTEDLGQYFFCSTADIFLHSVEDSNLWNDLKFRIQEVPPYHIINLSYSNQKTFNIAYYKAEFTKTGLDKDFAYKALKTQKTGVFEAPINFLAESPSMPSENDSVLCLEKLEDALFNYIKRNKNGKYVDKNDIPKIREYANLLQNLLQKEQK